MPISKKVYLGGKAGTKISQALSPGSNLCFAIHFYVFVGKNFKTSPARSAGLEGSEALLTSSNPNHNPFFWFIFSISIIVHATPIKVISLFHNLIF